MRVLFVYPDNSTAVGYSAGIGILAAILNQHGHETRLLHISEELGYSPSLDELVADIVRQQPGALCFSVTTPHWEDTCRIGRAVKVAAPSLPLIIGGPHVSADADRVMQESWVDFACRGEGDIVLPELVRRLELNLPMEGLNNLIFRRDGVVIKEPMGGFVEDLDSLPFENRDIFNYDRIIETRSGWAEVIVTRGCPFPCSYCFNQPLFDEYRHDLADCGVSLTKRQYVRRRSVESTIDMLKGLRKRYPGITGFTFVDDILAIDEDWFQHFTARYRAEIGLPYACTSHPLLFNAGVAGLLKDSGCKVVKMGLESGNFQVRRKILKRDITDECLVEKFGIAKAAGLKPQAFNMIGMPDETLEQMMDTVRLNALIKPYIVWMSTFIPYPGSLLYRECQERELIDELKLKNIDSYRGASPLKEEFLPALPFNKLRVMFRWHLNACLGNEAAPLYDEALRQFSSLPDDEWLNGSAERKFLERDDELDKHLRGKNISHYMRKNYINILWGREYDYDIS